MTPTRLTDLKASELKKILKSHNLSTAGTRATLLNRILDKIGTDEFEMDTSVLDEETSPGVVNELRSEISKLGEVVKELLVSVKSLSSTKQNNPEPSLIDIYSRTTNNTLPPSATKLISLSSHTNTTMPVRNNHNVLSPSTNSDSMQSPLVRSCAPTVPTPNLSTSLPASVGSLATTDTTPSFINQISSIPPHSSHPLPHSTLVMPPNIVNPSSRYQTAAVCYHSPCVKHYGYKL